MNAIFYSFYLLFLGLLISHPNCAAPERLPMADGSIGPISSRPIRHGHHLKIHHQDDEEGGGIGGPVFDQKSPANVTAVKGKVAQLACKVLGLGNRTVSWLRHDNLHIISAGRYTYTADDRFKAVYHEDTSEWLLRISNAQMRDEGIYECQVSTQPVRSFFVHLRVVVPVATILGPSEIYLDAGSTINITCVIQHTPVPTPNVNWLHQDELIDYTSTRGGVSVLTNKAETTVSSLIIQKARVEDGGSYACKTNNVEPASIKVHVLTGDNLRSLHTNSSSDLKVSTFFVVLMMTSSLVLIQCLNGSVLVGDNPLRITETDGEKDINISESSERETKSGCLLRKSSEIVVR